jgi:hypothetical protein
VLASAIPGMAINAAVALNAVANVFHRRNACADKSLPSSGIGERKRR